MQLVQNISFAQRRLPIYLLVLKGIAEESQFWFNANPLLGLKLASIFMSSRSTMIGYLQRQ